MNKIIQIVFCMLLCFRVSGAFVGCSEKQRTTEEIKLEQNIMLKEHAEFFDEGNEFCVTYSSGVKTLIDKDERAKVLVNYFEPIAKSMYSFYALTNMTISDKWSDDSRIKIYNGIVNMHSSLTDFANSKKRIEDAFSDYSGDRMTDIELVDFTNFVKTYKKFISTLLEFNQNYINAFFSDFYDNFYTYDGEGGIDRVDLKILLKHKAFSIAKLSFNLECNYYFDINTSEFYSKVVDYKTTKLCDLLNRLNNLFNKTNIEIPKGDSRLLDYKLLTDKQAFFDVQMNICEDAISNFDFKKMRSSREIEETYVAKADVQQQNYYKTIFKIANDYTNFIVAEYSSFFVSL